MSLETSHSQEIEINPEPIKPEEWFDKAKEFVGKYSEYLVTLQLPDLLEAFERAGGKLKKSADFTSEQIEYLKKARKQGVTGFWRNHKIYGYSDDSAKAAIKEEIEKRLKVN